MMLKYFCELSVTVVPEMMIHCLNYNRKLGKKRDFLEFLENDQISRFQKFFRIFNKIFGDPQFFLVKQLRSMVLSLDFELK